MKVESEMHGDSSLESETGLHHAKRVLITGAAGEIGMALVQKFRDHGLLVIATDVKSKPPQLEVDSYVQLDLQRLVLGSQGVRDELLAEFLSWIDGQGLDVLVNNAAIQFLVPADELDMETWQTSLNVNLLAPYFLVKSFLPSLVKAKGSVVNISSVHARLTKPGFLAYSTTKAALSGMTRAMAVELGNRVRVNAVEPASIETSMLRASFEGKEELFEDLARCHPQGRIGKPEEIASLVYSVALGEFSFLHGACIDISGGISARLHDAL